MVVNFHSIGDLFCRIFVVDVVVTLKFPSIFIDNHSPPKSYGNAIVGQIYSCGSVLQEIVKIYLERDLSFKIIARCTSIILYRRI